MAKAGALQNPDGSHRGYAVNCPGCGYWHLFDSRWSFNGDLENPSFTPSMLVNANVDLAQHPKLYRCHSYVTNGKIQFLSDSSHSLAGQTVELPEWDL